ncbi:tail fiber domain-containing protein [Citrobacter sp. Cpo030]|uniref:tail fiber domain-containing protein n=1 Tax=Citrobacter sp. Cpo030 TaxID=2985122 RepID=UPI0025778828|nr:tail fiber domain-containing protein [Citrobacter sp. Cpo030]MDM2897253.1 tail fiber domain-containing protein [Citrobacter sp. Cpo030]
MTTYATNNPPGSMDPKDLFDNSQNLDYALNDITRAIWTDRFGRSRKSYWGMEQAFSAQLLSQKQRFDNFIQSSGYEVIGEYTSGPLTIDEYNQLIRYQNELWKLTAATNIPFTTTGNDSASWANDSAHFVSVGDGALRQQISDPDGAEKYPELQLARWRDEGDIRGWGAKGNFNPTTQSGDDDTAAFLSAIASGRKTFKLPKGNFKITSKLVSDHCISWFGVTSFQSRMYFFDCDGFEYNLANSATVDANDQVFFKDISFLTTVQSTRTAINITRYSTTNKPRAVLFESCCFAGADIYRDVPSNRWPGQAAGYTLEWGTAVKGNELDSCTVSDVYIRAASKNANNGFPGNPIGLDISNTTFLNVINGCNLNFLKIGIRVTGQSEGVKVDGNDIVACETGYISDSAIANHHVILNCHINPTKYGVYITGGGHNIVGDNFFLKNTPPGTEASGGLPCTYIYMGGSNNIIRDNRIQCNQNNVDYVALGDKGIVLAGINNVCSGNYGYQIGTMHHIVSGAFYNSILSGKEYAPGTSTARYLLDEGSNTMCGAYHSSKDGATGYTQFPKNVSFGDSYRTTTFLHQAKTGGLGAAYDCRWEYSGGTETSGRGTCRFNGNTFHSLAAENIISNVLRPATPNTVTLGLSSHAWSGGFTQTAFTVTSDERHKTEPLMLARGVLDGHVTSDANKMEMPHSDAILDAWAEVDFVQFKYLDRVEEKGEDGARWHFGVIAQRVHEAFERHGLNGFEYGLICYDRWEDSPAQYRDLTQEEIDSGEYSSIQTKVMVSPEVKAGDKWGIRYEEALALEAALQRRNYRRLLVKYADLASRIEALEGANHA